MAKSPHNPMRPMREPRTCTARLHAAPRCGARTRAGTGCKQAAMRGKSRCRMHGGASTGPTTAAGIARMKASKVTHGLRTEAMQEVRRLIR